MPQFSSKAWRRRRARELVLRRARLLLAGYTIRHVVHRIGAINSDLRVMDKYKVVEGGRQVLAAAYFPMYYHTLHAALERAEFEVAREWFSRQH